MKYYVSAAVERTGDGTKQSPFKTIQEAAKIAKPGDEVIVAPGISERPSILRMRARRTQGSYIGRRKKARHRSLVQSL